MFIDNAPDILVEIGFKLFIDCGLLVFCSKNDLIVYLTISPHVNIPFNLPIPIMEERPKSVKIFFDSQRTTRRKKSDFVTKIYNC